ncbi:MAG: nitronate monooxygenase [Burkholderiales bacterium]|nr:MAG: nitronate monooxygenase [Burkholderiales bacterium]
MRRASWPRNAFTKRLGLRRPIVQAPMAGGITTPELVAGVSRIGALGSLAAAISAPQRIRADCEAIRALTGEPFAVNLFVLEPTEADVAEVARGWASLAPFRDELGLSETEPPQQFAQRFDAQLEALIELAPAVASFTFGIVDAQTVERLHARGCYVIGTATHVAEARAWAEVGADAVVAQGAEAGAHRGTFIGGFDEAMVGTMALVPQVVDAVRIPVLAAGGIMDGRGAAAAVMLGASAVVLGTAFLTCFEAGTPAAWKDRLAAAKETDTRVTRVFSGRAARGIVTDFMRRMQALEDTVPAYPIQNALTGGIRAAAARAGNPEYLSLWAGQGVPMARKTSAADLIERVDAQARELLNV